MTSAVSDLINHGLPETEYFVEYLGYFVECLEYFVECLGYFVEYFGYFVECLGYFVECLGYFVECLGYFVIVIMNLLCTVSLVYRWPHIRIIIGADQDSESGNHDSG